jgi:hypothetical protein
MLQHEREDVTAFLRDDFKSSSLDCKMINCPFYQNKEQSLMGAGHFKTYSKMFEYRCALQQDRVLIKTVIFIGGKKRNA